MSVKTELAESDSAVRACFPVMKCLREHLDEDSFVSRVQSQRGSGYQLAYLTDGDHPIAVAGFRISENLAWGRHLYIDDLVTLPSDRSKGYGARLLQWLVEYAQLHDCAEVHLDSGVQRQQAHRFYEREGFDYSSLHFRKILGPG